MFFFQATYGICIDPCCETRIASYHGQTVVIWDARNLSSSLLNILSSGTIKKVYIILLKNK